MTGNSMRWRLLWRAVSVRNQRILVVLSALTVGALIIFALASVYFDINIKMSRELRAFGANFYLGPASGHSLSQAEFEAIVKEAPAGLIVSGSPYLYGMARTERQNVVLAGVDFTALPPLVPYWQVQGQWISVDFDDRSVMLGQKLAAQLELKIGEPVTLVRDGEQKTFRVKGIIDAGDTSDSLMFINLEVAQQWLEQPRTISHALFSMHHAADEVELFAQKIVQAHPGISARPIRKVSSNEGEVLHKIQGLMGLVSVVILLLSTLCVNTSLMAIVSERQREFALQKSLGASNQSIMRQVLLETAVMALLASVLGCVLGFVVAQILGQTIFSASISLRWQVIPITFLLAIGVALGAAVIPLRRIMTIQPARVLRGE